MADGKDAWKDVMQVVLWAGEKVDLLANFIVWYSGVGKKNV